MTTCVAIAASACNDTSTSTGPSATNAAGDSGVPEPDSSTSDNGEATVVVTGGGDAFDAKSALAQVVTVSDRVYVSVSVRSEVVECSGLDTAEDRAVNFTLYLLNGTRPDLKPGSYVHDGTTIEIAGGFDGGSVSGGTVTLTEIGDHVVGDFALELESGRGVSGTFDSVRCCDGPPADCYQ